MANEIHLMHDDAAETVYAVLRNPAGQLYVGATPEAFQAAHWATYAIALTQVEPAASGNAAYQGDMPAVDSGVYWLDLYVRGGATPAKTDFRLLSILMRWDGSELAPVDERMATEDGLADAVSHGDENWGTADVSGLATADDVASAASAVRGADADTLKTLSDAMDLVAAAMAEIPTDPAGLTDEQAATLVAIAAKAAMIGSGRVTYVSTVLDSGLAVIWAGDDYLAADGRSFARTIEGYAGADLTDATATLRIMDAEQYNSTDASESVAADLEVTAAISIDGDDVTLSADLTGAQTAGFSTAPPAAARNHMYEFAATLASGRNVTLAHGQMTVRKRLGAAT